MPSGPFGNIGVNQTLIVSILIEQESAFNVPQSKIEDRFREKSMNPRADIRVDGSIETRQRIIWETRTDDVSVWNITNLMEIVGDQYGLDMETMEQLTSVAIQ